MKRRTAIIDIGSNSARLVIFEKTSRYGFHLICEQKSKVRIGEGAYEKEGYLQPIGIKRAYLALASFKETIQKYKARETLCVATSALRDAPNKEIFMQWVKKELDLEIKVIDGKSEAMYGAIAVRNLLPIHDAISIDIGGGSADMALIRNGSIVQTHSLNLGTVRLKELFFDKQKPMDEAKAYIAQTLQTLPPEFQGTLAIGIGGTARAIAKSIMKRTRYHFDKLHAFTFYVDKHTNYLEKVIHSSAKNLKQFPLPSSRFDTIREGTLILHMILQHIHAKEVMTSEVGVREGVYLNQLLQKENLQFPSHKNPSVESLLSRFKPMVNIEKKKKLKLHIALKLYKTLQQEMPKKMDYKRELLFALRLSSIGKTLTIYKSQKHAFYIAQQELNYGFTHKEMLLISMLLRMYGGESIKNSLYTPYKKLLPKKEILAWLSFLFTLTVYLHEASNDASITFTYTNQTLTIYSNKSLYLIKEKVKALQKPKAFAIIIVDKTDIPKNETLGIV
jgi:exopolyphosphatase/guanosine-5'-triphosphate,3'-diphosphate pyrophosphatase